VFSRNHTYVSVGIINVHVVGAMCNEQWFMMNMVYNEQWFMMNMVYDEHGL